MHRRQLLRLVGLGTVLGAGVNTAAADSAQVRQQGSAGGELVATFAADVKNMDPTRINDTTSSKAVGLIYETLMATDWEGRPQPYLAESVEQTGDTSYRVTLREGVTFHNGTDLTAQDVKTTFERYEGTPRESDVYDWYGSSTVVDDRTLDVTLSRKYAPFKFTIGTIPIVPQEATGDQVDLSSEPIGTGPYAFGTHQPDSLFRIQRNADHWFEGTDEMPDQPPIETVTFRIIVEQSAQLAALRGGDVDFINEPPAKGFSQLKQNDSFGTGERLAGGFDMLIYPSHSEADTPFQNRLVRLGTTQLIPREAILKTVYNGIGIPAYTPISPLAKTREAEQFSPRSFQKRMRDQYAGYNPEKARQQLRRGFQQAGYSTPFKTTIVTNQNPQRVKWAQLISKSLNSTEFFDTNVNKFEWNTYVSKVLAKDSHTKNQLVALGWSAGWDPDAYVHNLFHSDQFTPNCCNVNHYSNEEVDSLIERGLTTYDTQKRKQVYRDLQELLVKESPMAFIRFDKRLDAWQADAIEGFETYPVDGDEYAGLYAPYASKYASLNS
jgi:peptide/nickel transport system substrate-binding protein